MKILVTGASGFIGHSLSTELRNQQHDVIAAVRRSCGISGETVITGDLSWRKVLTNQDVVIHTAARTHIMNETEPNVKKSSMLKVREA